MIARRFPLAWQTLRDLRWQIAGYGGGLGLYAAIVVWLYPTFKDVLADFQLPEQYSSFFGLENGLSDPASYLNTEFQTWGALILVIYAVIAATGLLAGEEGRGTLELLLARPVTRRRVLLEKAGAFVGGALLILALTCAGWLLSTAVVDLGTVSPLQLVGGTFAFLPLVLAYAALALLLGAIAPSRGQAGGIMALLVIAGYLAASLARVSSSTRWMQYGSPFYYADTDRLLTHGPLWWHSALLLASTLVIAALALRAFEGRDLGAGTWQPLAWLPRRRRSA